MPYPELLLEEFNLIIFKVWVLMDVLSPCYPGWHLKGASVFPKWNTLCSLSHFFMSGGKKEKEKKKGREENKKPNTEFLN